MAEAIFSKNKLDIIIANTIVSVIKQTYLTIFGHLSIIYA